MRKRPLLLISLSIIFIFMGCDHILPNNTDPIVTPTPTVASTEKPTNVEPEYIEDSSELSLDCSGWADSVLMPYVDFDTATETTLETQAPANKIVTPRGYTIYLIDGYKYRELVGGIKIFGSGTNAWPVLTLVLEIQSYKKGTDIKEKILEWMKKNNTEFSSEETLDNPEISYIAHGKELPGNTGIQTAAYVLEKANPQADETVVAFTVFVADYPGLLKNLEWMIKTFRLS